MTADLPNYEVLALRFAHAEGRSAKQNFLMDGHDLPTAMAFYIWAIRDPESGRTIVVDTGFSAESAKKRKRDFLHQPADILKLAGIDPDTVGDAIITHMHWDHSGNTGILPQATFHLQDKEMAYATGRHMTHPFFSGSNQVEDVVAMVHKVYGGRVRFHDGSGTVAPGVTVHLIGGHTDGTQVVRVHTARGWVVLASDAAHYWKNIHDRNPFPKVSDIGKTIDGFRLVEEMADGIDFIIPGHDPEVLARFPRLDGHADMVRVDLAPIA
jgi:glyoxylase-like metal-dependent hydrolase (beta-lactamase superfamily II)